MIGCFFVALIKNMNFYKNFYFFNEIFEKYPDDLKKHVVNKVRRLKKFKKFFKKRQKMGNDFRKRVVNIIERYKNF